MKLTVELGWNYYRNLIPADFENGELRRIGVENYWINQNWAAFDLYFVAWKSTLRDKGRADQFSQAAAQLNDWVTGANSSWLARVRKSTSFLLGENNFNRLRHSPLLSRIYWRSQNPSIR